MADPTRLLGLLGLLAMMGALVLALRWTFGTGRNSTAPALPDPDDPTGDGLLVEVARLPTEASAQVLQRRLGRAGIRATVGRVSGGGYRLLVFAEQEIPARLELRYPPSS